MSVEQRAYRKALAEEVKGVVTRHAEKTGYAIGFFDATCDELGWSRSKLSRVLAHKHLRAWWAKFKREAAKRRRAARRRRARERALARGGTWIY